MRVALQGEAPRARPLIYSDDSSYIQARVVLHGQVVDVGFDDFLAIYVKRLSLKFELGATEDNRLSFVVSGKPELVDMLITVCWLGPDQALVIDLKADYQY